MPSKLTRRQFEGRLARGLVGIPLATIAPATPYLRAEPRRGIVGVLRGTALRSAPRTAPPDSGWRYGLGFPFQLAARKAALFCNIKGSRGNDFEEGTDVIPFDDCAALRVEEA